MTFSPPWPGWQMCNGHTGTNGPGEAIIAWFILPRAACDPVITAKLTMLSGVISNHQCAQYLGVHFAHYYSDKYYFIALIPPAVTNIVLGSRKHALLGSLILSENNWNADCFSDPSAEWLLASVLTVTCIFSCDQWPGLMGRAKASVWWPGVSMRLSSDWSDRHNTDLWLVQGLGVVSVHQPHSGTRWIADNKTDHPDSDWS